MDRPEGLVEFERLRLQALVARDLERAARMHRPDYQLVTPRGVLLSLDEYLTEIREGHITYVRWEPVEMRALPFGDGAALRYKSTIEMLASGNAVPTFECRHTGVYEWVNGGWLAVMSHATAIAR